MTKTTKDFQWIDQTVSKQRIYGRQTKYCNRNDKAEIGRTTMIYLYI